MISLEQAKVLAESVAESCFANLVAVPPESWIRTNFFEEENCWLFLKNDHLLFRENCEDSADAAIVISKKGTTMTVADLGEDESALKEYLKKISDYLGNRGE